MKLKLRHLGLATMISLGVSNLYADEISDQIGSGLKAYEEKDYKLALEELKFAEAQLQELVNTENATLLPEPLEGWDAKEVKTQSMGMLGGGSTMTREYSKGKQSMKIEITANSPLLNMVSMMMKNPMMMASQPDMKPYRYKRTKGVTELKNGKLTAKLILAGQILVNLELKDRDKERLKEKGKEIIKQFLDEMDFAKIKEAFLE